MQVLIIEDEPHAAERLQILLTEYDSSITIKGVSDTVKKSVQWLQNSPQPDLIFMDIQLADGLSFEIFEQVQIKSPIIFTTAFDAYALKAFKVNSIDYILKPVDKDELHAAIAKYKLLTNAQEKPDNFLESIGYAMQMLTKKYKERFVIKVGEHLRAIETQDILFFFSLEKTTFCQTKEGRKFILDFTLDQLEGLLSPERFFRINRKYIVAVDAINDMVNFTNSRLKLILKTSNEDDIVVARERVQGFKNWLDR